ncbi:MAG: HAMP domain-containing protein [Planctomycetia bacterium]|nr:HAMP domain-containing protein [Planctomycetia bacterium]
MHKRRPIRDKLLLGGLLVGIMVATLSASSFLGIYSYRRLVRALSCRAAELPLASALGDCVGDLRLAHARALSGEPGSFDGAQADPAPLAFLPGVLVPRAGPAAGDWFTAQIERTCWALERYCRELADGEIDDTPFGDRSRERETARAITECLETIRSIAGVDRERLPPWAEEPVPEQRRRLLAVEPHLERLAGLAAELPTYLQERLHDLSHEVRAGYRMLIVTTWAAALAAAALLAALGVLTYRWVFRPLRLLGHGSRRVAAGDFGFRIHLDTRDEMAELAGALNDMTGRFQEIRDDLDRQVQLRTREVVRNEQLASVGFLAAGVAHEINNPLASIAMCAESLESRLETLPAGEADREVLRRYLELIQQEAFRCKGITEKLLDFSRLGEVRRQPTAILGLVEDVADMLRHVGRFRDRAVEIEPGADVLVLVNPQEIKQVVLNLLVNALDSLEQEGRVRVAVRRDGGQAVLTFVDDGCGMTDEVLEHLFEPFFTRRKAGQGTGLGLSIVHRIVADHGGRIEAESAGPGRGSTFRVTLPVAPVGDAATQPAGREVDHRSQQAA